MGPDTKQRVSAAGAAQSKSRFSNSFISLNIYWATIESCFGQDAMGKRNQETLSSGFTLKFAPIDALLLIAFYLFETT